MKLAVICAVYNEEFLLPHFLDWYCSQADTVFILDNESTDKTSEIVSRYKNAVRSIYSSNNTFQYTAIQQAHEETKAKCIGNYDFIMLVDCDEFIISKKGNTIKAEIEAAGSPDILGTQGFAMWEGAQEKPYDPALPLFKQRTWAVEKPEVFSKPVIFRPENKVRFIPGRHSLIGQEKLNAELKDPSKNRFYLLHYMAVTEEMYVTRRMLRVNRLSAENRRLALSKHYYDKTADDFRKQFREGVTDPAGKYLKLQLP